MRIDVVGRPVFGHGVRQRRALHDLRLHRLPLRAERRGSGDRHQIDHMRRRHQWRDRRLRHQQGRHRGWGGGGWPGVAVCGHFRFLSIGSPSVGGRIAGARDAAASNTLVTKRASPPIAGRRRGIARCRPSVLRRRWIEPGQRVKADSSGLPVIARSEATRQSPSRCATGWGLPRSARNDRKSDATKYPHAFTGLPWVEHFDLVPGDFIRNSTPDVCRVIPAKPAPAFALRDSHISKCPAKSKGGRMMPWEPGGHSTLN